MTKKGLVLEGGAMRGMFTAGVLDQWMEEKLRFDKIVGVSAGALFCFPGAVTALFLSDMDVAFLATAQTAIRLFALTYLTRWFSFATQSLMTAVERSLWASLISLSTALLFPVLLIAALWPLGLTGIWLNFAATSLLAGLLSAFILLRFFRSDTGNGEDGTLGRLHHRLIRCLDAQGERLSHIGTGGCFLSCQSFGKSPEQQRENDAGISPRAPQQSGGGNAGRLGNGGILPHPFQLPPGRADGH